MSLLDSAVAWPDSQYTPTGIRCPGVHVYIYMYVYMNMYVIRTCVYLGGHASTLHTRASLDIHVCVCFMYVYDYMYVMCFCAYAYITITFRTLHQSNRRLASLLMHTHQTHTPLHPSQQGICHPRFRNVLDQAKSLIAKSLIAKCRTP